MADSLLTDLSDMFADTIGVELPSADDGFGNITYGTKVDYSGRVSDGGQQRKNPNTGQEYTTKGKVLIATATANAVTAKARLTLPSDFDPQAVLAEEAIPVRDENGIHHHKAFF